MGSVAKAVCLVVAWCLCTVNLSSVSIPHFVKELGPGYGPLWLTGMANLCCLDGQSLNGSKGQASDTRDSIRGPS